MRGDEVGVMFFRGLYGFMSQQELNGAYIGSVGEEFYCEGVAEAMRVGLHFGDRAEALDGSAEILYTGNEVAVACPEKIVLTDEREALQRVERVLVQQYFERRPGLHEAEREVSGRRIEGGAAELCDIGDAESAVEKRVDQGAGALTDIGRFDGVCAEYARAGGDERLNFGSGKGERGDVVDERHFEATRGIIGDPLAIKAKGEKGAQVFNFLAAGAWLDDASGLPGVQRRHGDGCDRAGWAERGREMSEAALVAFHGACLEVAGAAVGEEFPDRLFEREPGGCGARFEKIAAARQQFDALDSASPILGLERLAARRLAAIGPDGAGAEREVLAFAFMGAPGGMPAIGGEHRGDCSAFLYMDLYTGLGLHLCHLF